MALTKFGALFGLSLAALALATPASADILYVTYSGVVSYATDPLGVFDMNMLGQPASGAMIINTSAGSLSPPAMVDLGPPSPPYLEQSVHSSNYYPGVSTDPVFVGYIEFGDYAFNLSTNFQYLDTNVQVLWSTGGSSASPNEWDTYSHTYAGGPNLPDPGDVGVEYLLHVFPQTGFTLDQNFSGASPADYAQFEVEGTPDGINFLTSVVQFNFTSLSITDLSLPVPEPISLSLFGAGLVGAMGIRRRKKA